MQFTSKELRSILESHEQWVKTNGSQGKRADLSNANLSNANLSGAVLSGAYLGRADLSGADLSGAYLIVAFLNGANLSNANLSGADLSGAYLREAYLSGAYLKGAGLSGARLSGANLSGANLSGADLSGAYLREAYLSGSVFSDTPLPTQKELLNVLIAHSKSNHYDQSEWCGTSCCLAGAAGQAIGNQALGVAVIMQVLPKFDVEVLYKPYRELAVAELERVAALYA